MQIVYFPYLTLNRIPELNFGNVKVWNFGQKAQEYIPDEALRQKVTDLLRTNIRGGRVIDDIGVVTIGNTDFRVFGRKEYKIIQELKLLLFLSFLSKNNIKASGPNAGLVISTSENFTPVFQNFELGNDYMAESTGYIVNIGIGGYKIPETKFVAHSHILTPMTFSLDGRLIKHLFKLKRKNNKLYKRILQATELLFQSYYNDQNLSINARILLQVGAFEVLLDLPETGQRKKLKEEIELLTNTKNDGLTTYTYEAFDRKTRAMVNIPETKSFKVKWADRFYTLRNHIIHGNSVKPSEFMFYKQRHIDLAVMFFILLVKKLLNKSFGKTIFPDEIHRTRYKNQNDIPLLGFVFEDHELEFQLREYFNHKRKHS